MAPIESVLPYYWHIFIALLKTPFLHTELVWGIVPLYFGWFMNELTSDKKSFNTAIQSGFSFLWAGAQWSQLYFRRSAGAPALTHNGVLAINLLVTLLVLTVGAMAFISGIRKRYPKHCSFLGHTRFANYFMITIFAIQSHYLPWTWGRFIAIIGFAIPIWVLVHLTFKPIRS